MLLELFCLLSFMRKILFQPGSHMSLAVPSPNLANLLVPLISLFMPGSLSTTFLAIPLTRSNFLESIATVRYTVKFCRIYLSHLGRNPCCFDHMSPMVGDLLYSLQTDKAFYTTMTIDNGHRRFLRRMRTRP